MPPSTAVTVPRPAPRNHEHDEDLVFDRFCRGYPAEDLPGHHAGQGDHAGCRHRIDGGHQRAAERLTRHRRHGPRLVASSMS